MTCGAGDGGVVVSASSITTAASTGSHMLKINGYSAAKQLLITGSHAKSCEFEAAGHTWCIFYYPNGTERKAADYISFFLRLARNVDGVVNARVRFSLDRPPRRRWRCGEEEEEAQAEAEGGTLPPREPRS